MGDVIKEVVHDACTAAIVIANIAAFAILLAMVLRDKRRGN